MIEPPPGLNEADFEVIEAAVMETARGRWFLAEYARRCRAQDTDRILSAIARLEHAAASPAASAPPPPVDSAPAPKGSLEARLQALVSFDRLPLAQKLELLG
jgi:hypothetical protein